MSAETNINAQKVSSFRPVDNLQQSYGLLVSRFLMILPHKGPPVRGLRLCSRQLSDLIQFLKRVLLLMCIDINGTGGHSD